MVERVFRAWWWRARTEWDHEQWGYASKGVSQGLAILMELALPSASSVWASAFWRRSIACNHTVMTLGDSTPSGNLINIPKSRTAFEWIGIPSGNRVLKMSRSSLPGWHNDRASCISRFRAMHSLTDTRAPHQGGFVEEYRPSLFPGEDNCCIPVWLPYYVSLYVLITSYEQLLISLK